MKKYLIVLHILVLTGLGQSSFSQSIAGTDPLSGSASIQIPIYTISNGQVSLPVSISYGSGVKTQDVEGTAGMGWRVNTGGQISRQVRGLPDDVTKDIAANSRVGWMSSTNTAVNAIGSFTVQNDGGVTCSKESSDIAYITTNFPFNYDTEPDLFYASAPGLSCQLIYNRATAKFVSLVQNDLLITFTTDPTSGLITSFTIINDKGIKYVFSSVVTTTETTDASSGAPTFFTTQYKQYQNGINYNSAWYLSSMTDASGNGITLTYSGSFSSSSANPISLYLPGVTTPTLQYNIQQTVIKPLLASIQTNNINSTGQNLSFSWFPCYSGQRCVSSISGMGRTFAFSYSTVSSPGNSYKRQFLRSFMDNGCATPVNYRFAYGSETQSSGTNYTTLLPDSASIKMDYWGYPVFNSNTSLQPKVWINPGNVAYPRYVLYNTATGGGSYAYSSTNGQNRSADQTNINVGNLIGITYANGGTTTIAYESNSYIDIPSNQVVSGGGVRVKQITDYDGMNTAKNIVRNYSYNDPATGQTSGKPVSLPVFAFTIPYSGSATGAALWNANTVLSDYDLSDEDHSIFYGYSKITQTGAGSTLFQYYLPATNWDNSAVPACNGCTTPDWAPAINNTARSNCSSTYGPMSNGVTTYPFVPNPNYDFERGLLQVATNYNDAGTTVSESRYTYQRSFTPSVITAFKYDDNPNGSLLAKSYNKYKVYYNTSELTATVTKKVFDSPTLSQAQSSTVNYIYGSSAHKQQTQQTTTNSDNSTLTTNIRYVKDYTATAGSNPNVNALYYLQQQNVNTPVETWQQVTRGSVTKTTSASLTLFKDYTPATSTLYLPSQQLSFVQPDGATSFTPYTVSGQGATNDPQYAPIANYTSYDSYGYLQTWDDANQNIKTIITDHVSSNPTATFSNAAYAEIAFSDFDTDPASPQTCSFAISGSGSFAADGSHSGNAYGLGTGQTFSKTIVKNPKTLNYVFSIWIKAASAGTLNFTLTGGATSTYSKSFAAGGWTYYEWKLPVNNMAASFTVSVTSSQAISIDDVLFYPDMAIAGTAAYNPITHYLVAETNTNGVSGYYQKDTWGRLLFQFDQDRNIIKKQAYFTPAEVALTLQSPTVGSQTIFAATPTTFTASATPCLTGVTYTWNFGDGTSVVTAFNGNVQSHTYTSIGSYTLTVTATHPTLGTQSSSQTVTVNPPPLTPQICQSGVIAWNSTSNVATRIVSCPPNASDDQNSYFTITSVGGSGFGALSYLWQISFNNGSTWSAAGSTTTQFSRECNGSASYKVRCLVSSTSGQTGTSNILQFASIPGL